MAEAESNNIIEKKVSPILYSKDLGFNDIIPYNLLNPRFQIYSYENPNVFTDLSGLFSAFPTTLYNFLVNNDIFGSVISKDQIYNYKEYKKGSIEELDYNYEQSHTVFKCNNSFVYDEANPNPYLGSEIKKFLESDKRIFIGFIKIGTSWRKLLGYSSALTGVKISGHMNSFIIDKEKNRLIRFEPKGTLSWFSIWCRLSLVDYLVNSVQSHHHKDKIKKMKFIHSGVFLKSTIMPQYFDIYCQTYSLCATLLYSLNPDFNDPLALFQILSKQKAIIFQNFFYYYYRKILNKKFRSDNIINTDIIKSLKISYKQLLQDVSKDQLHLKLLRIDNSNHNNHNNNTNHGFTHITILNPRVETKAAQPPASNRTRKQSKRTNTSANTSANASAKNNRAFTNTSENKTQTNKKLSLAPVYNSNNNSFEIV
jgi:hypothetical protein